MARFTVSSPTLKYYNQYDNKHTDPNSGASEAGGSCNMTSLAMGLSFYGISLTPDELLKYCDDNNLDRHSLEDIRRVALHFRIGDDASYADTMEQIKAHLLANNPVIAQTTLTRSGHIILITGFDEKRGAWQVYDPAGNHASPDGYVYIDDNGGGVWYPSSWFNPGVAPDGKVWAHFLTPPKKVS